MIILYRIGLAPACTKSILLLRFHWRILGGVSRDDTNSGCVAVWCSTRFVHFVTFLTVRSQLDTSLCDVNTQRLMFISLFTLRCGPKKSTWWEIGLHLTFKANWNTLNGTKFQRKRIHFIETFLLPSPSFLLQRLSFEGPWSVLYRESEIVAGANPRWDIFYC